MYQSTHTGAQVDAAVDKALSADSVPTPGSTNLVQSGGVYGLVSNRNLLDNGWFTVNQRGLSSYTGNAYTVDRWRFQNNSGTCNVVTGGITFTNSASGYGYFTQILDFTIDSAKTYTLSIIADGQLYSIRNGGSGITLPSGLYLYFSNSTQITIRIPGNLNSSEVISAIKLELGSVSTLANDAAPCFAEELAKCQYYYQRKESPGSGYNVAMAVSANTANTVYSVIPLARAMRYVASPTVNVSGVLVAGHSGGAGAVSSPTYTFRLNKSGTELTMNIVSASFATKTTYMLWQNINGYIEISCDL